MNNELAVYSVDPTNDRTAMLAIDDDDQNENRCDENENRYDNIYCLVSTFHCGKAAGPAAYHNNLIVSSL